MEITINKSDFISLINNFSEDTVLSFLNKNFSFVDYYTFYTLFVNSYFYIDQPDRLSGIGIPFRAQNKSGVYFIEIRFSNGAVEFNLNQSYVIVKRLSYTINNPVLEYKVDSSFFIDNDFVFQEFTYNFDSIFVHTDNNNIYSVTELTNSVLPKFHYRTFVTNNKYIDNSLSFLLAIYYDFVFDVYNYTINKNGEYLFDVNLSLYNYGSVNYTDKNNSLKLCYIDYLDYVSGNVVLSGFQYISLTYSEYLEKGVLKKVSDSIPSFPSSVDCSFYIDCDDCEAINDYFNMLFYAISKQIQNSESEEDMIDYTPVLTQIATNLSNMSNDVNTQLDSISSKLETSVNIDDKKLNITDVVNNIQLQPVINVVESAPYNPLLDSNEDNIY